MPDTSPERKSLRGRIAIATRNGQREQADDLRRSLRAVSAEEYIKELVAAAPPLTAEQREKLAGLLVPVTPLKATPRGRRAAAD